MVITVTAAINRRHFFKERNGAILIPLPQPVVMKKILVPTDFTQAAKNAGEYAISLAKVTGATVHLLHVDTEVMPVLPGPEPWTANANSLLANKDERIRQEVDRLQGKYHTTLHSIIAIGAKGDTINDTAKEVGADLLVLGIKHTGDGHHWGSTTLKMLRKSPLPVLLVPEESPYQPVKTIVLAIDFTRRIESTSLAPLIELAHQFDASVRVLHVEEKGAEPAETDTAGKLEMGRLLSPLTYYYDRVESDDVDRGILDFVTTHPTDLLVMIAHQHSFFERLFSLTHTTTVSFDVRLPMLVLKAR